MDSSPYIAAGQDAKETLAAINTALVGMKAGEPIFFYPESTAPETAWESWISTRFLPLISPHLVAIREMMPSISPREVVDEDINFSAALDPGESARSISAGATLKEALRGARHRPELDKVIANLEAQKSDAPRGHFPTLFAARCASHHVPLTFTLAAYLFFEFISGMPRNTKTPAPPPSSILPKVLPAVRLALDSRPPSTYRVA